MAPVTDNRQASPRGDQHLSPEPSTGSPVVRHRRAFASTPSDRSGSVVTEYNSWVIDRSTGYPRSKGPRIGGCPSPRSRPVCWSGKAQPRTETIPGYLDAAARFRARLAGRGRYSAVSSPFGLWIPAATEVWKISRGDIRRGAAITRSKTLWFSLGGAESTIFAGLLM